jgi:hypothetical protein
MNYKDRFGLFHDKPVINGRASSGNPGFYTAIAQELGFKLDYEKLKEAFDLMIRYYENHFYLIRHPDKEDSSPISREEILGWAKLGILKQHHLHGWYFGHRPKPRFNLFKTLASFILAIGEHRNFLWLKDLNHAYVFMFSVKMKDRHTILKCWGKYNFFYHMIHIVGHLKQPNNRSSRSLRWLKTLKDPQSIKNYFGPSHPFSQVNI